jgi:hypothetical protein
MTSMGSIYLCYLKGGIRFRPKLTFLGPTIMTFNKKIKFLSGVFLLSVTAWFFLIYTNYFSDSLTRDPNRCEIQGLINNCPSQPTLQITRSDGILFDDVRDSSKSMEVCMTRPKEFHDWCRSSGPVSARFYQGSKLIGKMSYP